MGDHVVFIPPVLASLKRAYPDCHITLITTWGFKETRRRWIVGPKYEHWGQRNQGGHSIHLMLTNPHVDQLVHWHDSIIDLDGNTCSEDGINIPTWSGAYFEKQKNSKDYDHVFELDVGIEHDEDPMRRLYDIVGLNNETYSNYQLYFTDEDLRIAEAAMAHLPTPRIVLLEGLDGSSTRGWDPVKVAVLEERIQKTYGVPAYKFGATHIPEHDGKPLTLRQNIATLRYCDVAIGVLSGPLHFAAATGTPTLTLYSDAPLRRTAPAYFLNEYINEPLYHHRTLLGPEPRPRTLLKSPYAPTPLTEAERKAQKYADWLTPGKQSTKAGLAPITVDEVMTVLSDMLGHA